MTRHLKLLGQEDAAGQCALDLQESVSELDSELLEFVCDETFWDCTLGQESQMCSSLPNLSWVSNPCDHTRDCK